MSASEIADRVLRGSENIDRMREEVWKIVEIIRAYLVNADDGLERTQSRMIFDDEDCRWEISTFMTGFVTKPTKKDIVIHCWRRLGFGGRYVAWGTINESSRLRAKEAAFVRQNLDVLIKGVVKNFPDFEEVYSPLFNAADFYAE